MHHQHRRLLLLGRRCQPLQFLLMQRHQRRL
jgi:hypothetical protein